MKIKSRKIFKKSSKILHKNKGGNGLVFVQSDGAAGAKIHESQ
jgi:hypothetical protein